MSGICAGPEVIRFALKFHFQQRYHQYERSPSKTFVSWGWVLDFCIKSEHHQMNVLNLGIPEVALRAKLIIPPTFWKKHQTHFFRHLHCHLQDATPKWPFMLWESLYKRNKIISCIQWQIIASAELALSSSLLSFSPFLLSLSSILLS